MVFTQSGDKIALKIVKTFTIEVFQDYGNIQYTVWTHVKDSVFRFMVNYKSCITSDCMF